MTAPVISNGLSDVPAAPSLPPRSPVHIGIFAIHEHARIKEMPVLAHVIDQPGFVDHCRARCPKDLAGLSKQRTVKEAIANVESKSTAQQAMTGAVDLACWRAVG